ncbi:MAG: L-threonylcarbamoyladenylate synthase [Saprospiraceae bacterium]|nr:L-threonylcarbamoyladenylate synthase [Saprospiraceae bacterium]MDW8228343.1 L-threonylcarbamoyladenylate synthase [Saprospiraceae bacterium]
MRESVFQTQIGADVAEAARWLEAGQCVAIPTETVYGLAANALDTAAVARIYEVKNRPTFDPLIVHVLDAASAETYVEDFPAMLRRLAENFWPGPLTVLLPKKAVIPDLVTSGLPRVALRAPAHPVARQLLARLSFPLAAPSANPFGYISPTTAQHVYDQLQGQIPYILDGGPCTVGVESTIVGVEDGALVVYRLGGVAVEAIEEAAKTSVTVRQHSTSNPTAPGMLTTHYAPRKRLLLWPSANDWPVPAAGQNLGLLLFKRRQTLPPHTRCVVLSNEGDLSEAAQRLFSALRTLDNANDVEVIWAEQCPDIGLGRAINDRLRRAAATTE